DGNSYIDYCCSWGALIHGHAHPVILQAVQQRMTKGTSFGITTEIEERLARKIVELVHSIEKVRFVSSGTEATMSAVRLARGFTHRKIIVKFDGNYHGHADSFLIKAGSGVTELAESSSAGIPKELVKYTVSLPYNELDSTREFLLNPTYRDDIAAVILEPIAGNMGVVPGKPEFIQLLRETTEKIGALLIFDEVITGFRVALGGAQSLYQTKPDLTCLGKIIGGGFPAAAFGGRAEIMDYLAPNGPVYQAGTLSGNPVAMEAGLQAIMLLQEPGFYKELERKANIITRDLPVPVKQVGSMFSLSVEPFPPFFRFLYERGIYIPPSQYESWFVSSAHQDSHLEMMRDAILEWCSQSAQLPY
ncbi:MAG: hypothetical protein K940chlam3_01766, partial [Chlamydiae bacterium]|nr:hypothetical protein [Chlamydiota bacterium]